MPILRVARAHTRVTGAMAAQRALGSHGAGDEGNSFDFGLLEKQSFPKWEIPCIGRRWTAVQNLTPLALSSAEKSVTVQKNKQRTHEQ